MSPSLEFYDKVSHELPVKPIPTKVHGVIGVAAVELKDIEKSDTVLKYFRAFVADLCQQFNGGKQLQVSSLAMTKAEMEFQGTLVRPWAWPPSALRCTNMS
jgi:hypothetical protein